MPDLSFYTVPLKSYIVLQHPSPSGGCIDVDLMTFALPPYEIGEYRIPRMYIRVPGQGTGTKLMSMLCADADKAGASLVLEASPYYDRSSEGVARLMAFYARFGFKEIEGHPETMRRLPMPDYETIEGRRVRMNWYTCYDLYDPPLGEIQVRARNMKEARVIAKKELQSICLSHVIVLAQGKPRGGA